jgi:peptide/nickel transport system substrate-binding protein
MMPRNPFKPAALLRLPGRTLRLALLGALLVGAGCNGDRRGAPGEDGDGALDHPTYSGGPAGGVAVVLADREPDELNPLTYSSLPASQAVHLMFRRLAQRDTVLGDYRPDLAESWAIEGDSTLVLRLRRDVFWHDGRQTTAADVVFTIERQADEAVASPRRTDVLPVQRAEARDSFTVALRLRQAGPYTINALLEVVPVPSHLLDTIPAERLRFTQFARQPVGNGFFRFGRWDAGQQLVLVANEEMPEGRPALDRIIMRFVPDMTAAMTELLAGQGDVLRVPADQKQRIETAPNAELHSAIRVRPAWFAWNTQDPIVGDIRVRQAILMAIDREALAAGLFGDVGEPAYSPLPPSLSEHTPSVRPLPHAPDRARALLDEAGWRQTPGEPIRRRNGTPLRIEVDYIATDQMRADVLVATQSMLRQVGIDLVPRPFESTAWVERLRNQEFQGSLWGWGWGPGVVGPNAEMVFHSRSQPQPNFALYSNPRVDALIDAALVTRDTTQLRRIWAEFEQIVIDDAVYAPLYLDPELFAANVRLRNVRFRGTDWWEDAPYWYIPEDRRLPRDRTQ